MPDWLLENENIAIAVLGAMLLLSTAVNVAQWKRGESRDKTHAHAVDLFAETVASVRGTLSDLTASNQILTNTLSQLQPAILAVLTRGPRSGGGD